MKRKNAFLAGMVVLAVMLTSCSYTTANLANEIKASVIATFAENGVEGVAVKDVSLVHEGGNHYSGVVTTETDGEVEKWGITVVFDGKNYKWEIPEPAASPEYDNSSYSSGSDNSYSSSSSGATFNQQQTYDLINGRSFKGQVCRKQTENGIEEIYEIVGFSPTSVTEGEFTMEIYYELASLVYDNIKQKQNEVTDAYYIDEDGTIITSGTVILKNRNGNLISTERTCDNEPVSFYRYYDF